MRFIGRAVLWVVVAAFALPLLMQLWFLGHIVIWKYWPPSSTAFMESRLEQLREKDPKAALRYQWVDYARISGQLKRAIGKFLQGHPLVASIAPAPANQGGGGVTVAELKD